MKVPFTPEQFFEVFKNYNIAVFPAQVLFYLMAIVAIYLSIRTSQHGSRVISGILAVLWIWRGVVYHFILFTTINKAAYFYAAFLYFRGVDVGKKV